MHWVQFEIRITEVMKHMDMMEQALHALRVHSADNIQLWMNNHSSQKVQQFQGVMLSSNMWAFVICLRCWSPDDRKNDMFLIFQFSCNIDKVCVYTK